MPLVFTGPRFWLTSLPIASAIVALGLLSYGPQPVRTALKSELGPIELGTAAFFFVASMLSMRLASGGRRRPAFVRAFYGAFAVAALVVALEEMSWGQHLFGWASPEWFVEHNKQAETSLHNLLANKPSEWLRTFAYVSFAAGFLVLPIALRFVPQAYGPGHWSHFLAPRLELVTLILLSLAITAPNKVLPVRVGGELRELTELYQAWAAAGYAILMRRRLDR